jgi:glycosyltransferase involved in cell wall biosynthesis
MNTPLVSIVTPSFNQGHFIEQTIKSVLDQDYPAIEYIVMDGGSTDDTLEILKRYEGRLTWVSEHDDGQSDAIDRGFARSSGGILAWLNSDDVYVPGAVAGAVRSLSEDPSIGFVYGRAEFIDRAGHVTGRHVWAEWNVDRLISRTNFIPQPAVFFRRSAYLAVGGLDRRLHFCMDYDLWIKLGLQFPVLRVPDVWAQMRLYRQTKTAEGGLPRVDEIKQMVRRYGRSRLPVWIQWDFVRDSWRAGVAAIRRGRWRAALGYWGPAIPHLVSPYVIGSGARVIGRRFRRLQMWLTNKLRA